VPHDYGKATRRAYSAVKKAKLESFTLHELRHSFRSYLDAIPTISDTRVDRYMATRTTRCERATRTRSTGNSRSMRLIWTSTSADMTSGEIVPLAATG